MRNVLTIISIFLVFFLIYFLQSNFFIWFTIAGVKPNLFVILVLFLGLFAGKRVGISLGVILGIILDLLIGKSVGITGIMLGIVGMIGGYFDKNFSKESRLTIMLMVIGATMVFEIGSYVINCMVLKIPSDISSFITILLIEVIYNSILTIIFYPLLQKAGYTIENTFKNTKILTRYF